MKTQSIRYYGICFCVCLCLTLIGMFVEFNEKPTKTQPVRVTSGGQATNSATLTFVSAGDDEVARTQWMNACSFYALYLRSADSVLAKVHDEESYKIIKFVLDNAALGRFNTNYGTQLMQQKEITSNTFALIFSTKLDEDSLNRINPNLAGRSGCYIPKMRTMVICVHHRLSAVSRALALIHEGSHAMRSLVDGVEIDRNATELSDEELSVFASERRILFALGGSSYSNVVALEKKRIIDIVSKAGEKFGDVFVTNGPYDEEMEKIFGEAASPEEKIYRSGFVNVIATFDLLDETYGSEPEKLLKLRRAYMTSLEMPKTREFVDQTPKHP